MVSECRNGDSERPQGLVFLFVVRVLLRVALHVGTDNGIPHDETNNIGSRGKGF